MSVQGVDTNSSQNVSSFKFVDNAFNMVRTEDTKDGMIVLGQFIKAALNKGERVAIVSFQNPKYFIASMAEHGFYFECALDEERLIYLYYKHDFIETLSLRQSYSSLIDEVLRIGYSDIKKICFENADILFNKQSSFLINSSVQKLSAATSNRGLTFLGQYIGNDSEEGKAIDYACECFMSGYFKVANDHESISDMTRSAKTMDSKSQIIKGEGFVQLQ